MNLNKSSRKIRDNVCERWNKQVAPTELRRDRQLFIYKHNAPTELNILHTKPHQGDMFVEATKSNVVKPHRGDMFVEAHTLTPLKLHRSDM